MRVGQAVAPIAVVGVIAAALLVRDHDSGPSPAPDDAAPRVVTDEEFCAGFGELATAQETQLRAASPTTVVDLKAAARRLAHLTVATAMPDDAKAGVAYVVEAFLGLPDDATAQDVVESDDSAGIGDDAHARALAEFVGSRCSRPTISDAK